jgi:hypothetical protein
MKNVILFGISLAALVVTAGEATYQSEYTFIAKNHDNFREIQ